VGIGASGGPVTDASAVPGLAGSACAADSCLVIAQPTGTVTLVFSDVQGSTRLLETLGTERYAEVLNLHRRLLRKAFEAHDGYEVDEEGDALLVAFAAAGDAVAAAAEAQQALAAADWPEGVAVRVRMGVHSGEPLTVPPKYVGMDVHRAARIMGAAHGGQVLVSQTTADLIADESRLLDLGEHRLKDLSLPQRLFQLVVEGAPLEFPPLRTLENRPTNLPVQRAALLGREEELAELQELLLRPQVSILSLTGPGGTGKTRLALQLGAELVEEFPNGVWFVSLSPLRDPELVVPTIARTLGLREDPSRPAGETLGAYLEARRMLLVLDNFEQVAESAAAVAAACGSAEGVKLLATSRSPLRLSGEHVFPVPPLRVPDPGEDLAALSEAAAVALFVERAVTARPDFALTEANATSVAELCAHLDGLPLAIELAAARARVLPPQAILSRLSNRFDLLTGGARDLDDRQQTLRATLDWSYELLSAEEQRLFAKLSVFTGGCRLDAAEAICAEDGASALEGIVALAEQSLLREHDDFDGEPRFWMLESIRAYAAERLAQGGEADAVAAGHFDYFARFACEAEPHWRDPDEGRWLARFASEIDNVRAALTYASESDPAAALEMATNLGWLWQNGYVREGEELLQELRAVAATANPTLQALAHAVQLVLRSDHDLLDRDEAQEAVEDCIGGGRRDIGEFLRLRLAFQHLMRGEVTQAEQLVELAEKAAAETNDPGIAAPAVAVRTHIHLARGRTDAARQILESALELPYLGGNTNHLIGLLSALSSLELIEGAAAEALAVAERALCLARGTNDRTSLPSVLYQLAQASLVLGDLDRAADYVEQADLKEREVRPPTDTSAFLEEIRLTRAAIASARGDTELARSERETALQFFADHDLTVTGTDRLLVDRYLTD
jgi:predicted ATPase/class 3 adenylate cyclase